MVSNDKNTDNPQKGQYKTLETDVIKAIKKPSPELFNNKTPEECKYMQKVAEIYLSIYGIILTLSTFIFAFGASYVIAFQSLQNWIFVIIGIILCISGLLLAKYWPKLINIFRNYILIILDAEEKILEGSVVPKPQQEINNITSNTHKNPISIEYIKAQLDLLKLIMAGFLGGMLVLANSVLQINKTDLIYQLIVLFILFVLMIKLMTDYKNYSKKLN